jgi:hypothetical protein
MNTSCPFPPSTTIGRAYLFDQCVNVTLSPPEDRFLITGLHTVSDISCKRCRTLIGWTYAKAYEPSQKYKEGKFIIEKINLHLEEADGYQVERPAGERGDKWRVRSMSWGSERMSGSWDASSQYGYPSSPTSGSLSGSFGRSGGSYFGGASSPTTGISNVHCNQFYRSPRTPTGQQYGSSADSSGPMSPRSPSEIVYEYRDNDDWCWRTLWYALMSRVLLFSFEMLFLSALKRCIGSCNANVVAAIACCELFT